MQINVKKLYNNAKLPIRGSKGAAGLDLFGCNAEEITLKPGEIKTFRTGIAIEIPNDMVGLIFIRSSLGVKHGITLANSVGVIDSDYRGELTVGLQNNSQEEYVFAPYERIAQLVIIPFIAVDINLVNELTKTERGSGGFGSTGKT